VSAAFLTRHWPAFKEWSTKAVRDAFFASPLFPRLLNGDSVKETIAKGVQSEALAYVGKDRSGRYEPFHFGGSLAPEDVEISDEMFVITGDEAKKHVEPPRLTSLSISPSDASIEPGKKQSFGFMALDQHGHPIDTGPITWTATGGIVDAGGVFKAGPEEGSFTVTATAGSKSSSGSVTIAKPGTAAPRAPKPTAKHEVTALSWEGQVPAQKWMNFYTKVLSRFAASSGLRLTVHFDLHGEDQLSPQKIEETKVALRELGLADRLDLS
jgi:hypothetical protein